VEQTLGAGLGRQDKSADCRRGACGWGDLSFELPPERPCHTFCARHQAFQRSERHPPILCKDVSMTACREEAGPAPVRQGCRGTRPRFAACGLDRLSLPRQRLAKRSWLNVSETAPFSARAIGFAHGRFSPPAVRSVESAGSMGSGIAGCWPDVSFSPSTAPTYQVRDSTRQPLGLRYSAGTSCGPAAQARPVELDGYG
jgi:hypothetical protein